MVSSLGTLSAYSVYSGQSASIYGTAQTSDVQNNQKPSATDNSLQQNDIEDTATISDEAKRLLANDKSTQAEQLPAEKKAESKDKNNASTDKTAQKTPGQLTPQQQEEVQKLKERDAQVRAHEEAHIAAAAGLRTSPPSFTYETGPDGKKYAVGGEVNISFTESGNPQDDLKNAETMRNAALAPADPSSQDRSVAQEADKLIQKAEQEITQQHSQQKDEITNSSTAKTLVGAGGVE